MKYTDYLKKISAVLESNEYVLFAYLFGSRVSGKDRPDSDYDIAFFPSEKFLNIKNKLDQLSAQSSLELELEKILGTDRIDLVNLAGATTLLRFKVIKNGKMLFEKDPVLHRLKVARWVLEYLDLKPFLDQRNIVALNNYRVSQDVTR
jgi:predicted nucleotidyltransferase